MLRMIKAFTTEYNPGDEFWRISIADVIAAASMIGVTVSVWIATYASGRFGDLFAYWDNPNYVYAGITLYHIGTDNPWTKYFGYPQSYFACHLPMFPLLVRSISAITFGDVEAADRIAILLSDAILAYAFRRALIAFGCARNPTLSTAMMAVFPIRLLIYHSVGATEPLFFALTALALVHMKTGSPLLAIVFTWLASITRIEGMAVGASIGLCFVFARRWKAAALMFATFAAPVLLVSMHSARFGDPLAYIHFNGGQQGLIRWPPLREVIDPVESPLYQRSFSALFILLVAGTVLTLQRAPQLGILSLAFMAYTTLLNHIDVYRYSIPCTVIALFVGFDDVLSSPLGMRAIAAALPAICTLEMLYAQGQIHSNTAPRFFVDEVISEHKAPML